MNGTHEKNTVTAQYSSPNGTKEFTHTLTAKCPSDASTAEKTAYLSELRSSTKKLQGGVNAFLTERMEEDKKGAQIKTQDEIEEEKYGEEPVDED